MSVDLMKALSECEKKVTSYFNDERFSQMFMPKDLREAVFAYINRNGKRLRPAVMMWSCGACGGDENMALPAACGVELFHTWTLVHDDIIDNDDMRRGGPTVHKIGAESAKKQWGFDDERAAKYGMDLAILTGDIQHGWSISLFCESSTHAGVDPKVVLAIINHMESHVVNLLLQGEALDVQYAGVPIEKLMAEDILKMQWMKTGALYEFAARAGAMIGLDNSDGNHKYIDALSKFASKCGIAFQLQDDILGLTADEKKLGKPIGSDIYEGKKTTIVYNSLKAANDSEKKLILATLGNRDASVEAVEEVMNLFASLGAIRKSADMALEYVQDGLKEISILPESKYRQLLESWGHFMINREF